MTSTDTPADRARLWREAWRAKDASEQSWFQNVAAPSQAALKRIEGGPEDGLIDIGGGASALVDDLVGQGWRDVTVLDIAQPALDIAQERLGHRANDVEWICTDLTEWQPQRRYDIWHDRAVFHFMTDEALLAAYRRTLLAALRPGGHAIIASFAPEGPEKCSGLFVRRHDAASIQSVIGPEFDIADDWRETHLTPAGKPQQFQWAILQRTGR